MLFAAGELVQHLKNPSFDSDVRQDDMGENKNHKKTFHSAGVLIL